jgi:hypothetical protein
MTFRVLPGIFQRDVYPGEPILWVNERHKKRGQELGSCGSTQRTALNATFIRWRLSSFPEVHFAPRLVSEAPLGSFRLPLLSPLAI